MQIEFRKLKSKTDGGITKQQQTINYTLYTRINTTTHAHEQTTINMYSYVHVYTAHHQPTNPPLNLMHTLTHSDTNTRCRAVEAQMNVVYTLQN